MSETTQPEPFEPSTATCDAAQEFIGAMSELQHWHTGETFVLCLMCGEVDSHVDGCPVPALGAWLAGEVVPQVPR